MANIPITITITTAEAGRAGPAFGDLLGLTVAGTNTPRSATIPEVTAHLREYATNVTRNYEAKVGAANGAAAAIAAPPIAPT